MNNKKKQDKQFSAEKYLTEVLQRKYKNDKNINEAALFNAMGDYANNTSLGGIFSKLLKVALIGGSGYYVGKNKDRILGTYLPKILNFLKNYGIHAPNLGSKYNNMSQEYIERDMQQNPGKYGNGYRPKYGPGPSETPYPIQQQSQPSIPQPNMPQPRPLNDYNKEVPFPTTEPPTPPPAKPQFDTSRPDNIATLRANAFEKRF